MANHVQIPENAVVVRLKPDAGQRELLKILENPFNREVWIIAGRRRGKTWTMAVAAVRFGLKHPDSPAACWEGLKRPRTKICLVGPDYNRAMRIWDEILFTFPEAIAHKDKNELQIDLRRADGHPGYGAIIKVYSAENIESMRGEGFDLLIPDEAAFLNETQVDQVMMPTILDRGGRLWAPSTPYGGRENWFCRRFLEVKEADERGEPIPGTAWWHSTSFDNPRIDVDDLKREISRRDPRTVDEEYYGKILDNASNWLDHTKLVPIKRADIPPNTTNCILIDSAWGKARLSQFDKRKKRRKDATVIAVVGQDMLGNAYLIDGVWAQEMQPHEAYAIIEGFLKKYRIEKMGKEIVADDPFFTNWMTYCKEHTGVPKVTCIPFNRVKDWKVDGIRYWAGELLYQHKMFVATDCAIWPHLITEIEKYNEADAAKDECHDDCLTIMADILQPGIWMGHKVIAAKAANQKRFDPFFLDEARKGLLSQRVGRMRRTRYGPN